jgi:hypothetical protein
MCSVGTALATLATGFSAYNSFVRPSINAQRANKFNYITSSQDLAYNRNQLALSRDQAKTDSQKQHQFRVQQVGDKYDEELRKLSVALDEKRRQARAALGDFRARRARSGLRASGSRLDTLYDTRRSLDREVNTYKSEHQRAAEQSRDSLLQTADFDHQNAVSNADQRFSSGLADLNQQQRMLSASYAEQSRTNRRNRRYGLLRGLFSFFS